MTKDMIIAIRKRLKGENNSPLKLIIDENYFVDERVSTVVWDDKNGLLYAIAPNQERENNVACPGSIHVTSYENIVMLMGYYNSDEMKNRLDGIKKDIGNITDNAITNTMKAIYDLSDLNMYHDATTVKNSGAYDDKINWAKNNESEEETKD